VLYPLSQSLSYNNFRASKPKFGRGVDEPMGLSVAHVKKMAISSAGNSLILLGETFKDF
jgi:hypothetical protein